VMWGTNTPFYAFGATEQLGLRLCYQGQWS